MVSLAPVDIDRIISKTVYDVGDFIGTGNTLSRRRVNLDNEILITSGDKIRKVLIVAPPEPSLKCAHVTIALPLPQAATYSLSLKMPGPVALPVPLATRTVSQVFLPSVECATRI